MLIASDHKFLITVLKIFVITSICYFLGYLARPYEDLSAFLPANAIIVVLILNSKMSDKFAFSFIFYLLLSVFDFIFSPRLNPFYINIPNLIFIITTAIGIKKLDLDLKFLSEIKLLKIFAIITLTSMITGIVGGMTAFESGNFLISMATWICVQSSTAILVIPLLLMYQTHFYPKNKFNIYPLLALVLYYVFILNFPVAVNICLIVPILILCAIFYNLRITSWLVTLNGFFLIFLISYGLIKTGSYLNDSIIFTSLNYYRISIVAAVSSALFIAVLINNNEMIKEKLRKSQWTDDLSQLWNRKGLIQDIKTGRFLGKSDSILLAIIDIDDFKVINDSFGHLMGDRVIIFIAEYFNQFFSHAGLYRYGGDEFILIMNLEPEQKYQHELEDFSFKFIDACYAEFEMAVTLSIGYTVLFEHQLSLDNFKNLLAHADQALYRSKSLGKNTVSIF